MSKTNDPVTVDVLLADALFRIQAIQNLLIKKGIISDDEFALEIKSVSKIILKSILEAAKVPGDLDKLLEDLDAINKKTSGN